MNTEFKLSAKEKLAMIFRYLRGVKRHFALGLLFIVLSMAFNALTPQIVRVTVDSVLGVEPPTLPARVLELLEKRFGAVMR